MILRIYFLENDRPRFLASSFDSRGLLLLLTIATATFSAQHGSRRSVHVCRSIRSSRSSLLLVVHEEFFLVVGIAVGLL